MKVFHCILLLALLLFSACGDEDGFEIGKQQFALSQCGGTTTCSCGDTLIESRTLTSRDPVVTTNCDGEDWGLRIERHSGSNPIVLDCNGYTITYNSTGNMNNAIGIYVTDDDVTVQNCTLTKFGRGIVVWNAAEDETNDTFEDITIQNNYIHNASCMSSWGEGIAFYATENGDWYACYVVDEGPAYPRFRNITIENNYIDTYTSIGNVFLDIGILIGCVEGAYIYSNEVHGRTKFFLGPSLTWAGGALSLNVPFEDVEVDSNFFSQTYSDCAWKIPCPCSPTYPCHAYPAFTLSTIGYDCHSGLGENCIMDATIVDNEFCVKEESDHLYIDPPHLLDVSVNDNHVSGDEIDLSYNYWTYCREEEDVPNNEMEDRIWHDYDYSPVIEADWDPRYWMY